MATMKEIGLGITMVLQTSAIPEPLCIDLWDGEPAEAAKLVLSVLSECHDAEIGLKLVRLPLAIWGHISLDSATVIRPLVTRIEVDDRLEQRIEFWRKEPT